MPTLSNMRHCLFAFIFLYYTAVGTVSQVPGKGSNETGVLQRDHSFSYPYRTNHWDFNGNAYIATNKVVLTSNRQSQSGALWNTNPINFPNWEVHIHFRIYGVRGNMHGDGIAFWYLRKQPPSPGPMFGMPSKFEGLGVFLDTYQNFPEVGTIFPYISVMLNNGSLTYDHSKDGFKTKLGGCSCQFRNKDHDTRLVVRYENQNLTVSYDVDTKNTLVTCFHKSHISLPTGYYLAMSAMTGDLVDNHEIFTVLTYKLPDPSKDDLKNFVGDKWPETSDIMLEGYDDMEETSFKAESTEKPSTFLLILVIFAVTAIIWIACVGARTSYAWYKNYRLAKKRFY